MKKGTLVGIVAVVLVLIVGVSWQLWKMGVVKGEIVLSNRYDAQERVVETTLDTMRKSIKNIHKCTDEWADKFIATVAEQAKGRPGKATGGTGGIAGVMAGTSGLAVTRESEALGIPDEMYLKLANAIAGGLDSFKRSQDTQNDLHQTHKTYCEDPYHNWLGLSLASEVKEAPVMISSTSTKEVMETKVLEDDLL
jgi:hypothetical protein